MRIIKSNYFFGYALMGSVMPYLSIYLRSQDLTNTQIGYILGTVGVAILLSPVALTLIADAHMEGKTLLAAILASSSMALVGLLTVDGFWPIFVAHAMFCLAFVAIVPLQDGLNFEVQAQRRQRGDTYLPYHRIRVWGTMGFIVPSIFLYVAFALGAPIGTTLTLGAAFGVLGVLTATRLPRTRSIPRGSAGGSEVPPPNNQTENNNGNNNGNADNTVDPDAVKKPPRSRLPTFEAVRAFLQPHVMVFCLAMFFAHMANSAYYAFYPLYLSEQVGVANEWVGLITNVGVVLEIAFMLAFGWLLARFGVRWLVAIGLTALCSRMVLLYAFPNIFTAIATQVFHGLHIIALHIVPPIFLNRQAQPHFRNSIQGLYAMTVYGVGRILGSVLAGGIADESLLLVFGYGGLLTGATVILFIFLFRDHTPKHHQT